MSPDEMDKYRDAFNSAAAWLGWTVKEITVEHERDYDCSWKEIVWLSASGERLFSESDTEEGMVREIIRLGELLGCRVNFVNGSIGDMLRRMNEQGVIADQTSGVITVTLGTMEEP